MFFISAPATVADVAVASAGLRDDAVATAAIHAAAAVGCRLKRTARRAVFAAAAPPAALLFGSDATADAAVGKN